MFFYNGYTDIVKGCGSVKVKQLVIAVSVLLIVVLLGGCGTQPAADGATTTTLSTENSVTVDTSITGEPTADCIRTTPSERATHGTSSTSTTTASSSQNVTTSRNTVSTSVATTMATAAPTVNALTPLAASSYYGLSQLQDLPNGEALVTTYKTIAEAVQNCQTTVDLDETLTESEILTVFYYYRADYPQHFWCDGSIRYAVSQRSNTVVQIKLQYTMTGETLRGAQVRFKNAVIALLEIAATGNNEYERELLLHDALAKSITYQESDNAHNAYGALVEGKAVCEGYARAFQYLLYQSGIQCLIAEGSSINPSTGLSEGHAWNVVRIDGRYYHVDLTWDDPDDTNTPVMYAYFNLTTVQINEDHTISTENSYSLPNCIATAANFHVQNGTRLTTYTVDGVAAILKGVAGDVHVYCVNGSETFVEWFQNNHKAVMRAMGINHGYSYSMLYTGKEVVVRLTVQGRG